MLSRLREMFQATPKPPSETGDGTRYLFKPSLAGGARQFELTGAGLRWQGARARVWPLSDIAAIRLSYRPSSMQSWRFRADVQNRNREIATLYSTTWHSISMMARQDDAYRAFIVELHRRLAAAGAKVFLVAGINPFLYGAGLIAMVLIAISIAGLFVRALWIGEFAGALFLVAFAGWFVWQIGGFMKRNRPRAYTLDALPGDLLP